MPAESGDETEQKRNYLCMACGRLKNENVFEEGRTICNDCIKEGRTTDRFREAPDGYGYVLKQTEDER